MMMSMEEMSSPSPNSDAQDNIDANAAQTSTNQTGAPPSRLSQLCRKYSCCCSDSQNGISLNKIEPVIFQPLNDIYLQLKPHRRLRVIHINGQQGAIPTHSPYYLISGNSDSDDEEYWFQNADPKRPKINQPPVKNVPKRIFHKLEPQVRPTLEQLSPSNLVNNVRLPRKTILNKESPDLDLDDELSNSSSSPSLMKRNPDTKLDDQGDKEVITLPEPGESSTDEPDNSNESSEKPSEPTATIEEAGQKLGGMANVAFESEETQLPNSPKNETKPQKMYILPAIFYVHGVGGSANIWANQIEYFAQLGHEVIAPDLLGHGFSSAPDKPKSYTFPKILRDILTIFDHFIPRSREVVVVGHSYGCSMAAALARSRPESVKLLVMCASGGPTPLAPPKQLSKVPKSLIGCLKPFLKCRFGTSQKYVSRGKATKIQEAFDVPAYVLHHVLMGQLWPEGDASYHRKIQIPTLLVYGMKDPLVSLVEMCEMERTIPKAYLELIPLAGHMLMQDQPTELNIMMKKFITRYFSPSI